MKKKIVIEIEFDENVEEFEDETYTHHDFSSMCIHGRETTLLENEREKIAERWAQSDWYSIGFTNSLIDAIAGERISRNDIEF